jgi:hypothetical protein
MSLSLSEMASFITSKVGQFDATSVALCKRFIAARYGMVFDSYFWSDARITARVVLDGIPPSSTFPVPEGMDRIVSMRLEPGDFLDPVTETFLIESDTSALTETGTPRYYSEVNGVVRLYPAPERGSAPTIYIFGKRTIPPLSDDDDVSILRNCDNAIIAFAMGDMLERARQYAKAQAKFQEAASLLEEAKSVEKDQANQPRRSKYLTVAGNSLSEMTDAVCAICGQWTPDMRILVKDFLRRNYLALYDLAIWPESTVAVRVPFLGEQVILPEYVDRVISVRSSDRLSLFPAEISLFFNIDPFVFESQGAPVSFSMLTPCGVSILPKLAPEKLVIANTDASDAGKKVFVRGESHGREVEEEVTLTSRTDIGTDAVTMFEYDVPLAIAKPITVGSVTINGFLSTGSLEVLGPNEREKKHPRIWLLPIPTVTNETVLVLGKRKIKPLLTDEDTPIITGCQNVLISGAAADLFAKLGNNDQSNANRTKADAAAKVLISLNTDQNALIQRFIPAVEPSAWGVEEYCWSK